MRASEIVGAELFDLNTKEGLLKVYGNGNKERIAPIGIQALITLSEYVTHVRPKIAKPDCKKLFLFYSLSLGVAVKHKNPRTFL